MALSDNLIAYYPLEEASGNAIDAHGSNDLTETGGTITSTTGKVGNCRDIEANDSEWFEIADNADLSTGDIDFTVAFWVRFESLAARVVASKFLTTGDQREWWVQLVSGGTPQMRFLVSSDGVTNSANVTASTFGNLSTATWYFVVAWHDSVNDVIGIAVNDTANTAAYSSGVFDGTAKFILGVFEGGTNFHDGLLDEFGFWKRVLTSEERTWIYNAGSGRSYADIIAGMASGSPNSRRFGKKPFGVQGVRIY